MFGYFWKLWIWILVLSLQCGIGLSFYIILCVDKGTSAPHYWDPPHLPHTCTNKPFWTHLLCQLSLSPITAQSLQFCPEPVLWDKWHHQTLVSETFLNLRVFFLPNHCGTGILGASLIQMLVESSLMDLCLVATARLHSLSLHLWASREISSPAEKT